MEIKIHLRGFLVFIFVSILLLGGTFATGFFGGAYGRGNSADEIGRLNRRIEELDTELRRTNEELAGRVDEIEEYERRTAERERERAASLERIEELERAGADFIRAADGILVGASGEIRSIIEAVRAIRKEIETFEENYNRIVNNGDYRGGSPLDSEQE